MIKHWIITGDTHGRFDRFKYLDPQPDTAVIILGDVGLNYNLNDHDRARKRELAQYPFTFYCVRGNHEARPSDVKGMHLVADENVGGALVWIEDDFPSIRYFCDWGIYNINGLHTLVVGGAYSVDKRYRLAAGWEWFPNEQLSRQERAECSAKTKGKQFDLVLSHTCPLSLQPTDLFLRNLDQSTVDNTMETWLEEAAQHFKWKLWLFGHYHTDRIEWPHCEIFYAEMEDLNDIVARWARYNKTGELDWWLPLSPKMNKISTKGE